MQLLQEALTLRSDERERESLFLRHEQDGVCPGLTVTQVHIPNADTTTYR